MSYKHLIFLSLPWLYCCSGKAMASTQLFMAGDSTMAIKQVKDYPETGWGVPFQSFFSKQLTVINLAKNGRSTRTFIAEGLWQQITDNLKTGDYVIIQFGHNDESANKKDRYTTQQQFQQNLIMMIEQVRNKGAFPLLMSPVTRRYFAKNSTNKIVATHPYSVLVRKVAKQTNVNFIDMDLITREYFAKMGSEQSSLRFMHIKPNVHPNYPNGIQDNTHFNQLGAREVAQLVLGSLKSSQHPLVQYIRQPDPKHLSYSYQLE